MSNLFAKKRLTRNTLYDIIITQSQTRTQQKEVKEVRNKRRNNFITKIITILIYEIGIFVGVLLFFGKVI